MTALASDHSAVLAFKGVAGQLVTGVTVVVTLVEGAPIATTAGSVVVASWDPPAVVVLFRTGSRIESALSQSSRFTVNVLGEADLGLARRLARSDRGHGWDALAELHLQRRDPAPPVLERAIAWMDCATIETLKIGDHRLFVGEVLAAARSTRLSPLAYYRGRFTGLGATVAPAAWATTNPSDLTESW
jgi:flavin reductase (DIM6/NTAB) family NADH-FMN oxidoreductase RutF